MPARLLDGQAIAATHRRRLSEEIHSLKSSGQRAPGLAVVLVGDHPASRVYVHNKRKACREIGMDSFSYDLPGDTHQAELLALIDQLNHDRAIDGILVQLPLPPQIDAETVIEAINPSKDVDGFHPYNIGRLAVRMPRLRPCTPWGVMQLLASTHETIRGRHACIIGASNIVGRPMALELLLAGATISVCHRFTRDTAGLVKMSDIVVAAAGKPGLVQGEWIQEGAIVVDVGITRLPSGQLVGDVDFAAASERASWITPVPGGVGPMTVAMLLDNTLRARRFGSNEPKNQT